jgi:ketosteroid isomerase-like protein
VSEAEAELEAANARFYRVFEALDLAAMEGVWAHEAHVTCIHPGWPLLRGWLAVRESWVTIFANTEEMRFTIADVHLVGSSALGIVTCTENILSGGDGRISVTSVLATNAFERSRSQWKLIHHHASHVMRGP